MRSLPGITYGLFTISFAWECAINHFNHAQDLRFSIQSCLEMKVIISHQCLFSVIMFYCGTYHVPFGLLIQGQVSIQYHYPPAAKQTYILINSSSAVGGKA